MISYLILIFCIFSLIITYSCLKISKVNEEADKVSYDEYVNKNKNNEQN